MIMQNKDNIRNNVRKTITAAIEDGTTGMGLNNLFQITPTTGVTCSVPDYILLFGDAVTEVAKELNFPIY